jgi:uncharacterized membrane protein HdeD (DUF308 family)
MFSGSPIFVRVHSAGQQVAQKGSWLVLIPGLMLTVMGFAIVIWPQLLAYMVAGALIFVGFLLLVWGWSLRRAERLRAQQRTVYYEVR